MNKHNYSVSGEGAVTAATANEMKNLVKSFNEMIKEQVRDEFDTAVITLNDIVEQEGEENKCVDFFSIDFDFGCDYEAEWRKFVWEQIKMEPSVAIEFHRGNRDLFINDDAMEEYVRSLADEYGVDDYHHFISRRARYIRIILTMMRRLLIFRGKIYSTAYCTSRRQYPPQKKN